MNNLKKKKNNTKNEKIVSDLHFEKRFFFDLLKLVDIPVYIQISLKHLYAVCKDYPNCTRQRGNNTCPISKLSCGKREKNCILFLYITFAITIE